MELENRVFVAKSALLAEKTARNGKKNLTFKENPYFSILKPKKRWYFEIFSERFKDSLALTVSINN